MFLLVAVKILVLVALIKLVINTGNWLFWAGVWPVIPASLHEWLRGVWYGRLVARIRTEDSLRFIGTREPLFPLKR